MEIIPTSLEITSLAAPELPISITNKMLLKLILEWIIDLLI